MANLEHSKSWNPEPWSVKLNSLIVTFHFFQKPKIEVKKLKHNHYTNALSKDAILSENVDLKKKKKKKKCWH